MTHLLNIDEAVDRKFLVTKNMKGQAETGTIIHVMDAENNSGGSVNVTYRVARFNEKFHDYQDYTAKFDSLAAFCKWAQPDNFIATFASFCLPIILIAAVIIWALLFIVLGAGIPMIIIGVVLTCAAALGILVVFKKQKKKERVRLYQKISSNWGVVIK